MGTGMPMPTFVWQTIPHAQDLQAQIRSDLVNFWPIAQWKFSSQKGMKNNFLAKPRFEPVTAEFPQYDDLTIQPQS